MNEPGSLKYYPHLDVLRGFAILWVLVYHVNVFFDLEQIFGRAYWIVYRLCDPGELGVDLFFVLSGFLIAGLLYEDLDSRIRIKRFYSRRFFKIIPQYLVATLAGLLLLNFIEPFDVVYRQIGWGAPTLAHFPSHNEHANVLSHFLFYQNFVPRVGTLSHTWSLAIEEHFYFLFPLLLVVICRLTPEPRKRRLVLFGLLVGFIVGFLLTKAYYAGTDLRLARMLVFNRYEAIAFGCLLRLLEPQILQISPKTWRVWSIVFLVTGLGLLAGYFFEFNRLSVWGYPRAFIASGLLILAFLRGEPFAFLKPVTHSKILTGMGKISYGLYLWHYIIIFPFHHWRDDLGEAGAVVLYIGTAVAAGIISTNVIEKYFLNLRAKVAP